MRTRRTNERARRRFRRVALLGGTTTWGDFFVALRHLLAPRGMIRGDAIEGYENAFARKVGVGHACSFASGRVALFAVLRALDIGEDDEVLVPVPTHVVVANAVRYAGAKPVFVDCGPDDYNMDVGGAEAAITAKTRGLILQHTFGIPADVEAALGLANRYGLQLIEDCVHALGATYDGRPVGSFGRGAFFSTEETKTISTTMGGMAVTDDDRVAHRLRVFQARCEWPPRSLAAHHLVKLLVYHVATKPSLHWLARAVYEAAGKRTPLAGPTTADERLGLRPPGYERRLSNAQAALGLRQLSTLARNVNHRREITRLYEERLSDSRARIPKVESRADPAFVRYPVAVENRMRALAAAAPYAVLGTWFTSVLEEAVTPSVAGYPMGSCPNAEAAAQYLVNLPTHPRVSASDALAIVDALLRTDLDGESRHS